MTTITIETENATIAKKIVGFLKTISSIHSITVHDESGNSLTDTDWVKPGRPATDEEHEQMLNEAEESPYMSAFDAGQFSKELIEKWSREK